MSMLQGNERLDDGNLSTHRMPSVFAGNDPAMLRHLRLGSWVRVTFKEGCSDEDLSLLRDLQQRGIVAFDENTNFVVATIIATAEWADHYERSIWFTIMRTLSWTEQEAILRLGTRLETVEVHTASTSTLFSS